MRISAPGTWTAKIRGFTLLEVLVTLLLVGIITGLAVLSVGDGGGAARPGNEARRLAAMIDLHRTEGLLRGEQRGVLFSDTGYQFLRYLGDAQWTLPETGSGGDRRELPTDMSLSLEVEGRAVDLHAPATTPQVLLLSSGESTEFQALFSAEGQQQDSQVSGDLLGNLQVLVP